MHRIDLRSVLIFDASAQGEDYFGGRPIPLLRYLTERGVETTVAAPRRAARAMAKKVPAIRTIELAQPMPSSTRWRLLVNYFLAFMSALFVSAKADVVIAMTGIAVDHIPALVSARRTHALSAMYLDNVTVRNLPKMNWWATLNEVVNGTAEKFYSRFDVIFAGTEAVQEAVSKLESRVVGTSYGIETEELALARAEGIHRVRHRCIYVGRLNEAKGIFDLLRAWPLILEKLPEATLEIFGRGDAETENRLHRELAAADWGRSVLVRGFVDSVEKFRSLLRAEVMIFPSYSEQRSTAVVEALASGLPVVAYDIPGLRANFEGQIMLCQLGNIEEIALSASEILAGGSQPATSLPPPTYEPFFEREFELIDQLLRDRRTGAE